MRDDDDVLLQTTLKKGEGERRHCIVICDYDSKFVMRGPFILPRMDGVVNYAAAFAT